MARTASTLPEQGQLVDVRQRRYAVTDVIGSTLPSSPLRPTDGAVQHLVSLAAVEDDAFGEELQAIWELEPGTRIHETVALPTPTGFDDPGRLDAFLDAVRWGAASTADMRSMQAPFRSGIDLEDYQLDPLVRGLQMPRVNLLIADDQNLRNHSHPPQCRQCDLCACEEEASLTVAPGHAVIQPLALHNEVGHQTQGNVMLLGVGRR